MRRLAVLLLALAATGCDAPKERAAELPPVVVVRIEAGADRCSLDGRPMNEGELRLALSRMVEGDKRADRTGSRATVRLVAAPGADLRRVDDLMAYCQGLGINRIELPVGGR
jgi:hypothetical protein